VEASGKPPVAVLWDLGGVFLDWEPRYLYRKLFAGDEAAMEHFLANVCTPAWHAEQDLGRSVVEACTALAASRPEHAEMILAWGQRSEEMIGGVISGSVGLLAEMKAAGVRQYALSNMEPENWEKRRLAYQFISWFDGWFISGIEGVAKPGPEYFKLALERYGLSANEAFFVDDKEVNVQAAAALGVPGCMFRGPDALRAELAARGLPVATTGNRSAAGRRGPTP
jgi:FMN phosphatase YigB (HAD superfamily)